MMAWTAATLGEVCDQVGGIIQTGPFGSQLHQSDYSEEGIPVVMPKDIIEGRIVTDGIARVTSEHVERLSRHKLRPGDIIYGRRGDIGRQALIRHRQAGWLCGTGCLRLNLGDSIIDPIYLHYYLREPDVIAWITNQAIGATLPNLNTNILRSVPIRFPLLPTQRKIAAILSAYDDLIENNLRRIKILEEMAQNLYREWFVKFRFPGHEKTRFVDSPLGRIPEGWEALPFTEMADVLSGGTPKTTVQEYWGGTIHFFAPKDSPDSFYVIDTEKMITELGLKKCNSKLYPKDTIFITARGTVGKVVMSAKSMAMNQSCYALHGKEGVNQFYLFLATREHVDYLKKNTGGATFDTIVVDTFKRMLVARPVDNVIEQFSQIIQPGMGLILSILKKNEVLRRTRDLLLPKLISGEVDVSELDITIPEEAA